jgi:flavin reductase
MGSYPTGVTVLTASTPEGPRGMTANAVTSLSLDPLLILACVKRGSRFAGTLGAVEGFAVNILAEQQSRVATWFASPARFTGGGEFDGLEWRPSRDMGAPLLDDVAAHLDCRIADVLDRGDHTIVLGEVIDGSADPAARPLVWLAGRYTRLGGPGPVDPSV